MAAFALLLLAGGVVAVVLSTPQEIYNTKIVYVQSTGVSEQKTETATEQTPEQPSSADNQEQVPENKDPVETTKKTQPIVKKTHKAKVSAEVDIAQLSATVQKRHEQLDRCFRQHADDTTQDVQNVSLRFSVSESGAVESAAVLPAEVGRSPLGRCLQSVAQAINFGAQPKSLSFRIPVSRKAI
ncbi:MAG: hypothetical protein IPJ88_14950 [Myxococcales bacterium]|nr:MAG: hypothetical protein IPJ88_14950 [Myxococcales bacterium]